MAGISETGVCDSATWVALLGEEALLQCVEEAARLASLQTTKNCAVATRMPCHLPPKASNCVISRGCCLCFWFKSAGLPLANAGDVQEILQGCPCCGVVGVALAQVSFEASTGKVHQIFAVLSAEHVER